MKLCVNKKCQTSSGGSHVTVYEAEIELAPGEVVVEILGVFPEDAYLPYVELARESIRKGAEEVLQPRGMGARILVHRVVVHEVDFNPHRFQLHTAEEIQRPFPE